MRRVHLPPSTGPVSEARHGIGVFDDFLRQYAKAGEELFFVDALKWRIVCHVS